MGNIVFKTKYMRYEITEEAQNAGFFSVKTGQNRVLPCPCAVIVREDHSEIPAVSAQREGNLLKLVFEDGTSAQVLVQEKEEYLTFTLNAVSGEDYLAIAFVNIRLDDEAESFLGTLIGMTLSTRMEEHPGDNRVLRAEAFPAIGLFGSDRSPYPAKAAVIGCCKERLRGIEKAVLDEIPDGELPKSSKGGPYADTDKEGAMGTYTIFTETVTMDNVEDIIAQMKRFRISQINLHHMGHYVQGDFRCFDQFPAGVADFKKVVDRFHEEGMLVGLQTYAFFVSPRSKYVCPVPHRDLDTMREFTLAEAMDESQDFMEVCESTEGMTPMDSYVYANSPYLWIDDELVRFAESGPNRFVICERGSYGTVPARHGKGSLVRQLKQYFHLPMAKAKSELFYEIARNTAQFYNECGADMFYLDALDGSAVLEGEDYVWYHAVDFIREMFNYLEKDIIFDCCYNPQYTGSWFVRSRYGAIDYSKISHRDCLDAHVLYNEETAERMGVTPELGWVNLYMKDPGIRGNWQIEAMLEEDVEYLCAKSIATDASIAVMENISRFRDLPCSETYARVMTKYDDFRKNCVLTQEARSYMRQPQNAVYLDGDTLYCVRHAKGTVERAGDEFAAENPFEEQIPSFKLETLCTADGYDSEKAITLCELDETRPLTDCSFRYENCVRANGNRGLGVWCKGDGSGCIVCINLRNFAGNKKSSGEHFIRVDFTGWKYFAFYESQNGSLPLKDWPRTDIHYQTYNDLQYFYGHYRAEIDYDAIDGVDITVKGEGCVYLKDLRLVPHRETVWENPMIQIGDSSMKIHGNLPSDTLLAFDGEKCTVSDLTGKVLCEPAYSGRLIAPAGECTIRISHEGEEEFVRAKMTLNFRGGKLQ